MTCRCGEIVDIGKDILNEDEYVEQHLKKIGRNALTWAALFQCPETGILWKRWLPHPEAHGGGPRRYEKIGWDQARTEFEMFGGV